ncbi:hypothetical protein SME36J_50860 (plasmid) [Serratia marcescens]|nr:hypothetical protein SME36J_50860 [Serratia marcescens]
MGDALKPCVDCGKGLSRTAQVCNECNSTDPFGGKRLNDKIHLYFVVALSVVFLAGIGLWQLGIIDPVEILGAVADSLFKK